MMTSVNYRKANYQRLESRPVQFRGFRCFWWQTVQVVMGSGKGEGGYSGAQLLPLAHRVIDLSSRQRVSESMCGIGMQ